MALSIASNSLDLGRAACARQAWRDAEAYLAAADREYALGPADLERLATATFLIGRETDSFGILARAHHGFWREGHLGRAVRSAAWMAFFLVLSGDSAHAGAWIARGRRLLDESGETGIALGFLLLTEGVQFYFQGEFPNAWRACCEAMEIGTRFGDIDLIALARYSQGKCLVAEGRLAEGLALLDESMLRVTSGGLCPTATGQLYSSLLETCYEAFDVRRAKEWAAAMKVWCVSQSDVLAYRGECLFRRAEHLQLDGAWPEAMDETMRACEDLSGPPVRRHAGSAFYQRGELHRLRGEYAPAEAAYRDAGHAGLDPQPGLALLRLAKGRGETARAAIDGALEHTATRRRRSALLAACVEIALAEHDVDRARQAAAELGAMADEFPAPYLCAMAAHAHGHVMLVDGQPEPALRRLREGWMHWGEISAPYEAARTRVLIALAHRQLGDEDTATMELDAARQVFARLGAAPDLAQVDALAPAVATPSDDEPLTAREREVLLQVASGKTNRAIAEALAISEKTVARHVSTIFMKLAVSTRAAATAYAHRNGLV